jgi:hypothetical protein
MIIELEEQAVTGKILAAEIMLEEETIEVVADSGITAVVKEVVVDATIELAEVAITEIQVIVTLKKDIKPLSDERFFPWAFLSSIFEIIALRMALTVTKR